MEKTAEIVERLLPLTLLPDDRIDLQPDQLSLGIVIEAAPPALPVRPLQPQNLHRTGCIFERTPSAAGAIVEHGRCISQPFAILVWRRQPRPRRQNIAQILGQTFINPEQIAEHWILIISRDQARRTPIFSVP